MELFLRFPGGKPKALTLSYDDGVDDDIRLITLMNQYGMKGTFNINTGLFPEEGTVFPKEQFHRRMTKKQVSDLFSNSPHEVAVHTLTHPHLEQMPFAPAMAEILDDCQNLEEMFGQTVRGIAYPYHGYTDDIVDALKKSRFLFGRTVNSSHNFAIPENPLALWPTCHHEEPELMDLTKKFIEADIDQENPFEPEPYLFYVWGHSYEFEWHDNWEIIENFIKTVSGKKDVWYATNGEIFGYIDKWKRMDFTLSGRYAQNPTDIDLFMLYNGRYESIKSGETKKLSLV